MSDPTVILRCDGACINNPSSRTGVGMVLLEAGELMDRWGEHTEAGTSNEAEYSSIEKGLEAALDQGYDSIIVLNDNKMVVNQINGDWNTKSKNLKGYKKRVRSLLENFNSWEVSWVRRDENQIVDEVANKYAKTATEKKQNQQRKEKKSEKQQTVLEGMRLNREFKNVVG